MEPIPTLRQSLVTLLTILRQVFAEAANFRLGHGLGKDVVAHVRASGLLATYSEPEFSRDARKHPNDVRAEVIRAILLACRIVDRPQDARVHLLLMPQDELIKFFERQRRGSSCEHLVAVFAEIAQTIAITPTDANGKALSGNDVIDVRTYVTSPHIASWLLRGEQRPHLGIEHRRSGGALRIFRMHRDRVAIAVDEQFSLRTLTPHRLVSRRPVAIDPPAHDSERCLLLAVGASNDLPDTSEPHTFVTRIAERARRRQLDVGLVELDVRRERLR